MLKQAVMIAAVAAKKKAILSKKADDVVPNLPSKRPYQEVERICEAPALQNVLRSWHRRESGRFTLSPARLPRRPTRRLPFLLLPPRTCWSSGRGRPSQRPKCHLSWRQSSKLLPRLHPRGLILLPFRRVDLQPWCNPLRPFWRWSRDNSHNIQNERRSFWKRYEQFRINTSMVSYFNPMLTPSFCCCRTMPARRFHWRVALVELVPRNP